VTAHRIKEALERIPLLTIDEMAAALNARSRAHGFYAWWLVHRDALPDVPTTPHPFEPVGLLYVGVGPGGATSLKRTLRDRFIDHTRRNTATRRSGWISLRSCSSARAGSWSGPTGRCSHSRTTKPSPPGKPRTSV
jgi:hypothetical protein